MNSNGNNDIEEYGAEDSVSNSVPWWNERRPNVTSNLSPVKSDWYERDTSPAPKQLVDDDILGSDESGESEDAESCEEPPWDPVPDKAAYKAIQEEPVSRDAPTVGIGRVGLGVIVQSVE